jgi:tryptophanyl-tRNA synthetase
LIEIYAAVRDVDPAAVEEEFSGKQYGHFKIAVGEAVAAYLKPVRERYADLRADEAALERVLREGADKARAIALDTLALVRDVMGVGGPQRSSVN